MINWRFVLLWSIAAVAAGRVYDRDQSTYIVDPDSFIKKGSPANMTIGLLCVGTTGDLNPFMAIALKLQDQGHRVRLATHAEYRDKVLSRGLEFYPLGGDPKALSEFMVKSKGSILPSLGSANDALEMVPMLKEIVYSTWKAMSQPDPESSQAFRPDALIANPPAYGHIHIAEKLQIPLIMTIPQPWIKTKAFAHPLSASHYKRSWSKRNELTYALIRHVEWVGIKYWINPFRHSIGLNTMHYEQYKQYVTQSPYLFTWSPHLIPKPKDWGDKVDIVGTVRLPEDHLIASYDPSDELQTFLNAGPAPIFIGFGSMVMSSPERLRKMIFQAAVQANRRVILQSGWTDFSKGSTPPENVFVIGRAPHSWLFEKVSAVVHHGGAGTTAAGLYAGKPTFIVPFFGDQFFWGQAVMRAKVGVKPKTVSKLTTAYLVKAFQALTSDTLQENAKQMQTLMNTETGTDTFVDRFYHHLPPYKYDQDGNLIWL